ncbi:MMPL family transporter [Thalassomonas viridans]|uniref:MMPL family transporter n=1 Tax=Thalassomonas viridans TaxID=137584 RepID=A0AAE9Z841_9GAMM|nr:MMPL family transporter [Thalassomonas viridans]WDE08501.1 MMPL family transporter [Thalassomonas viridans]
MQLPQNNNANWTSRYADWLIRYRWLVMIAAILLAVAAGSGGRFITPNNDYRVFFSPQNPQLQAFEQIQRTYTKTDNILIAIAPKNGEAFSKDILAAVEEATEKSWKLPFALRVDSVSNFQHTIAEQDDLIVADLVENAQGLTLKQIEQAKKAALAEPVLRNILVNEDASVTGINITFQMPQKALDEAPQAVNAARALAAELEAKYEVEVYLTGMVMLTNAFFEASMSDMGSLVPAMYLIILVITFLLVRSVSATIGTFLVIMFSIMTGMGLAGYAGIQLTPPSSAAMTIIMTLAVADSVHILVTMMAGLRRGLSKHEAIRESVRVNFNPVLLTSVTTAIGFLSMNFSDTPPFHDLGNMTAMGVTGALIFSLTFLPALMSVLPVKAKVSNSKFSSRMDSMAEFVIRRQRPILLGSVVLSVAILSFIPNNTFDDNFLSYFDNSISFRTDSEFVNNNLTGIYQLQYSLDAGKDNGVSDPEFLHKLNSFIEWLRQQPEVRHVNTIGDTFKRLNKNMHQDNADFYRLPSDPELAAQYLLLYELSLPYGLDLNNQLNISKSSTQVIVTLNDMGSVQLRDIAERGTQWLKNNTGITSYGVGPAIMFAYITERNITGMIYGTLSALVLISLLIMVALRSFRIGLLSLIPNLLPAGLAFGIWGFFVGEVNMAVSMVTGMALGIVVDDTIHFLSKYLRARREEGMNAEQAVRYAFSTVGVAIIVTSVILIAGFAVLSQSAFGLNSIMATLTALSIAVAIIADFLLLPALLLKIDGKTVRASATHSLSDKEQGENYASA